MACQLVPLAMTLKDLQGISAIANLFKCSLLCESVMSHLLTNSRSCWLWFISRVSI